MLSHGFCEHDGSKTLESIVRLKLIDRLHAIKGILMAVHFNQLKRAAVFRLTSFIFECALSIAFTLNFDLRKTCNNYYRHSRPMYVTQLMHRANLDLRTNTGEQAVLHYAPAWNNRNFMIWWGKAMDTRWCMLYDSAAVLDVFGFCLIRLPNLHFETRNIHETESAALVAREKAQSHRYT